MTLENTQKTKHERIKTAYMRNGSFYNIPDNKLNYSAKSSLHFQPTQMLKISYSQQVKIYLTLMSTQRSLALFPLPTTSDTPTCSDMYLFSHTRIIGSDIPHFPALLFPQILLSWQVFLTSKYRRGQGWQTTAQKPYLPHRQFLDGPQAINVFYSC